MSEHKEPDAPELVEMIGNHVAAEYEDDPALDGLILQMRAASKPRTVTTAEELDALPRLTVVLTGKRVWQKLGGEWPYHEWQSPDGGFSRSSEAFANLNTPATIVYTPEVTR